jgi:hypothetical protein
VPLRYSSTFRHKTFRISLSWRPWRSSREAVSLLPETIRRVSVARCQYWSRTNERCCLIRLAAAHPSLETSDTRHQRHVSVLRFQTVLQCRLRRAISPGAQPCRRDGMHPASHTKFGAGLHSRIFQPTLATVIIGAIRQRGPGHRRNGIDHEAEFFFGPSPIGDVVGNSGHADNLAPLV